MPIISENTQQREEGYFRLEWKLAVDRSHLMADDKAFFFPVVLDDVPEPSARVPEKFRERQWTRLHAPSGENLATRAFAERIARMYGAGVNPTPRLEPLTPGAGSNPEYSANAIKTLDPGLRGNDEAQRVPVVQTADPTKDATPSIAVLAFANRSSSADDEYFSDGLADELLNVLAKIKGLRVAARTSAFSFKGKQTTIAEIGRMLNVAAVFEGTVRKSGNRVRISVQLVKVDDGFHLWSETYDRTLDDIFAVQDDIAQSVVTQLRGALFGLETDSARRRSSSPDAHRLLLKAQFLKSRGSESDRLHAIALLREALSIDPRFALAWAALSRVLSMAAALGDIDVEESAREAKDCATRALLLEPDLVEGHVALAFYQLFFGRDWLCAEQSVTRALAIAPDDFEATTAACQLYFQTRRLDQAVQFAGRAIALDPLNAFSWAQLARALEAQEEFAEAETAFHKALELSPGSTSLRVRLSFVLARTGRLEEALAEASREAADWARWWAMAVLHFFAGNTIESDRSLNLLLEHNADHSAAQIAMIYAVRGDADNAFAWIERAYTARDSGLAFCKVARLFEPLHNDPRWPLFLKKMGFDA